MIALKINSVKQLMASLLKSNTFDNFLLEEAMIQTFQTFTIDGHVNTAFFSEEDEDKPKYDFIPWEMEKELAFNLIKGKRTPSFFKFVLHLKPENNANVLASGGSLIDSTHIKNLSIIIRFDSDNCIITTGVGYNTFVMTKEPEKIFDEYICHFLSKAGIDFEEL